MLSGLDRRRLEEATGCAWSAVLRIAETIDGRYKERRVRVGGKTRALFVPEPELKLVQRKLCASVFQDHAYPEVVYCCRGRGVLAAARRHQGHPFLFRLDIADFSPGVSAQRVRSAFAALGIKKEVIPHLVRLVTFEDQLPQGAPTSVAVGNLVLTRLDNRLGSLCKRHGLSYTRYVDDLVISGGKRLQRFESTIRGIVRDSGWRLNEHKTEIFGPKESHRILGLIVNSKINVDERYVSDLRLVLKLARAERIQLSARDQRVLQGKVAWIESVNRPRAQRLKLLLTETHRS